MAVLCEGWQEPGSELNIQEPHQEEALFRESRHRAPRLRKAE